MNSGRNEIEDKIVKIIFLFGIGALSGWIYEVLLHMVTSGNFANRGILHGPWLPIYGIGCLVIVGLKRVVGNYISCYLIISIVASGVMEYMTSWLMEEIYHRRWWDYSEFPLNLNGRIFAGGLLGFGIAGTLVAYLLLPILEKKYVKFPEKWKNRIAFTFLLCFMADVFLSLWNPNMGAGITK